MSLKLVKSPTFPLKIDIAAPPEKPVIRGSIVVHAKLLTKPDVRALSEEGLPDEEYLPRIAEGIEGLEDADGNALTGQKAFDEVLTGSWSMYLLPAIVQAFFEQFGEARRKNFRGSRAR